jgi:hypothetical protein
VIISVVIITFSHTCNQLANQLAIAHIIKVMWLKWQLGTTIVRIASSATTTTSPTLFGIQLNLWHPTIR